MGYEGEWRDDQVHGRGSFEWGAGEFTGDKYEGEFVEGKRVGKGTYLAANGARYDGEWSADVLHGRGIYLWPTGDKYDGEWKFNKIDGRGTYEYSNGDRRESGSKELRMAEGHGCGQKVNLLEIDMRVRL